MNTLIALSTLPIWCRVKVAMVWTVWGRCSLSMRIPPLFSDIRYIFSSRFEYNRPSGILSSTTIVSLL